MEFCGTECICFICRFIAAASALNRYIQMQMFTIVSSVSELHAVGTEVYYSMGVGNLTPNPQ